MPVVIKDDIVSKFQLTEKLFGQFAGIYYLAYALVHIPLGILVSRYRIDVIISISILLATCGITLISYSEHWYTMIGARVIIGAASACSVVGGLKLFRDNFGEKHFATAFGYMMTIGLLVGAVYGTNMLSSAITSIGLETIFNILIAFGLLLAIAAFILLPKNSPSKNQKHTIKQDLKTIFSNKPLMILSFTGACMIGPLEGFADAWGADFMMHVHGLDYIQSTRLCSLIFLGMAVGTTALPNIERILRTKLDKKFSVTLNISIILCAILLLCLFSLILLTKVEYQIWQYYLFFSLLGFFSGYQVFIFAKAAQYAPGHLSGLATSMANMIMMSFGELYHSSIGIVAHIIPSYHLNNDGIKIHNIENMVCSMYPIQIALLIATVLSIAIYLQEKKKYD